MADEDSGGAAETFAGIAAQALRPFDIEGGGKANCGGGQRGLDQRLAHPASGAGNGEPHRLHGQGTGVADGSPIFLNQSMILPMKPASSPYGSSGNARVAAVRFSSCTDFGISSPSQRASASPLK